MPPLSISLAAAAVGAAISIPLAANAAEQSRLSYDTAARACQGALPQFAGTLRARPLAVGNEGAAPAFVTCGWAGREELWGESLTQAYVKLGNNTATAITINCTFVHGFGGGIAAEYVTRAIAVPANAAVTATLFPADLASGRLSWPQVSCNLPPGAVVHYIGSIHRENVGN